MNNKMRDTSPSTKGHMYQNIVTRLSSPQLGRDDTGCIAPNGTGCSLKSDSTSPPGEKTTLTPHKLRLFAMVSMIIGLYALSAGFAPAHAQTIVTVAALTPTATEVGPSEPFPVAGLIRVTRSGGDTTTALTVNYSLGGTAVNGTDYQMLPGSVTIPAGSVTAYIDVIPIQDVDSTGQQDENSNAEEHETVIFQLTLPTTGQPPYSIGPPGKVTVTIAESIPSSDQPTVAVTALIPNASEVSPTEIGPHPGLFRVTRSGGDTTTPLTVHYSVGGTAVNGTDYQRLPGLVTIAPGSVAAYIHVTPIQDADSQTEEHDAVTLQLTLPPAGQPSYALGSPGNATVTIAESTPSSGVPMVTLTALTPGASEAGPSEPDPVAGLIRVTRSGGDASTPLTVHYSLGGSAVNGTDYQRLPGSVTIPAGSVAAYIQVMPIHDAAGNSVEHNAVVLQLTLPVAEQRPYSIGSLGKATVTISETASEYAAPEVTLWAPKNRSRWTAPATVLLLAEAQGNSGIISQVEFFSGATSLGFGVNADMENPNPNPNGLYFLLVSLPAGQYAITAKATDNEQGVGISSGSAITVR
jgi:Calx-beta domain